MRQSPQSQCRKGQAQAPEDIDKFVQACESICRGQGVFLLAETPKIIDFPTLFEEENAVVEGAVDKRKAEFATARKLARQAIAHLGHKACSLHPYQDRSPRWPTGVVGSIAHNDHLCMVAVAPDGEVLGLGVDVESSGPLQSNLWPIICHEDELRVAANTLGVSQGVAAKLVFCAKEAVYKCQYRNWGLRLDFLDVVIEFSGVDNQFSACGTTLPCDLRGWVHCCHGQCFSLCLL